MARRKRSSSSGYRPPVAKAGNDSFRDWPAFLEACERPPVWQGESRKESGERSSFTGTESFPQALRFARLGWPEGRAKMVKAIAQAQGAHQRTLQRTRALQPAGMYPCVPAAIAGHPCAMVSRGWNASTAKPVVAIDVDVSVPGSIPADCIINHGAAALSAVKALEDLGYSVDIGIACWAGSSTTQAFHHFRATFKKAGEKLDVDRAAFALASPSILRRFLFSLYEQYPDYRQYYPGYGYCLRAKAEKGRIMLPAPDHACTSVERALERVLKALKDDGVVIPVQWGHKAYVGSYEGAA